MSTWKRDFARGLVVLAPLLVIAFVASWLYARLAGLPFLPKLENFDLQPHEVQLLQVLIVLVVFLMLVFAVGYLMRTTAGRLAEDVLDDFINRVPGIRVLYNASKLAIETAVTGTEDLQKPVKLETWPGVRMTAFKTGKRTADGREVLFMPTAPNITTGFVIEVDPADLTETDEKVEEALTRILSAGFGETSDGVTIDVTEDEPVENPGKRQGNGSDPARQAE